MRGPQNWTHVIVLAVIGFAAALAISVAIPIVLRSALATFGDSEGQLLQPIVSLASALLAFAGVGISGVIGLNLLRQDHDAEARSVAAALSGECRDLAALFLARSKRLQELLDDKESDPVTIALNDTYPLPTVIYEAVAPKIGLLPVDLANSTVVIYGRALGYKMEVDRTRSRLRWQRNVLRQQDIAGMFQEQGKLLASFARLSK